MDAQPRRRQAPYGRVFAVVYILVLAALWSGVVGAIATTGLSEATPRPWSLAAAIIGGAGAWLLSWQLRKYRPELEESRNAYAMSWYRLVLGIELPSAIRAVRGNAATSATP